MHRREWVFLDHGTDPDGSIPATSTLKDTGGYTLQAAPLLAAVFGSIRESRRQLVEIMLVHGADPARPDALGDSPLSLVSGERIPGIVHSRNHKYRHHDQLMRASMDADPAARPTTPAPVTVGLAPGNPRFADLALCPLGDRARWPEMVRLNGLKDGESITVGTCVFLPPRHPSLANPGSGPYPEQDTACRETTQGETCRLRRDTMHALLLRRHRVQTLSVGAPGWISNRSRTMAISWWTPSHPSLTTVSITT